MQIRTPSLPEVETVIVYKYDGISDYLLGVTFGISNDKDIISRNIETIETL